SATRWPSALQLSIASSTSRMRHLRWFHRPAYPSWKTSHFPALGPLFLCSTFHHSRLSVGRIAAGQGQASLAPRSGRRGRRWPLRRIALTVNGIRREAEAEPRCPLVYLL